jgi:probable phosphoglycerate mutase
VQVVLLRHGRTPVNAEGRLSGRHDPDLDELGLAQAAAAGTAVAAVARGPVTVVSSPLRRCLQTAGEVVEACGDDQTVAFVDERFIELDYGEWDNRPLAEVPPEAWRQWRHDPDFAPPGGETLAQVSRRVVEGLDAWVPRAHGGTLVVVSHVSPIKAAVTWALGVGDAVTWRMRLDNASLCRLDVVGEHAAMRSFNETAHLIDLR